MKKSVLLVTVCLLSLAGLSGCGGKTTTDETAVENVSSEAAEATHADGVELVLFHGKQRCVTCRAIEVEALAELNADFAQQVEDGKVTFRLVDFSTLDGEKEADAYRVASSSLYINRWKDGQKTSEDLTQFAFANARKHADKYREGLRDRINQLLK